MRKGRLRMVAVVAIALVIMVFWMQIGEYQFPAFRYADPAESTHLLESGAETIGQEVSAFLWKHRGIDLIGQALVLFATAIGCLVLIHSDGGTRASI